LCVLFGRLFYIKHQLRSAFMIWKSVERPWMPSPCTYDFTSTSFPVVPLQGWGSHENGGMKMSPPLNKLVSWKWCFVLDQARVAWPTLLNNGLFTCFTPGPQHDHGLHDPFPHIKCVLETYLTKGPTCS
jgi:hypothetical protein